MYEKRTFTSTRSLSLDVPRCNSPKMLFEQLQVRPVFLENGHLTDDVTKVQYATVFYD